MGEEIQIVIHLLAALAVGLLIGIERGWSGRQEEEGARVAGLRTFSLIGLLGGVFAEMSKQLGEWVLIAAFIAVAAMIIVGHIQESRRSGDIGTTTAFSMMLTFALAAWAAMGQYVYALGTTVVVVALLGMKPVLHRWISNIETEEIYAGIKLLIISVVLLPLLPNQGFGPWEALNPRWIWWMVVLICGISFVGYFAIKYSDNRMGTLVTSITGGLASSTAVTLSMADFARRFEIKTLFMGGVMVASSIMFIRILIEVAVVNPSLLHPLWIPLLLMFTGVLVGGFYLLRNRSEVPLDDELEIDNPFKITMALKFGLFLAVIKFLSAGMLEWFGEEGVYVLAVVSGLMDVDAITLSLSRLALTDLRDEVAVLGIILAAATNTVVKGLIFSFIVGFKKSLILIGLLTLSVIPGLIAAFLILS
ncbi:MAG: MgtC/SapB family protein [Balneolaceae bacterium]|nr:MAG: MgtC/SapB family protein [Balneolaceae bacterium]